MELRETPKKSANIATKLTMIQKQGLSHSGAPRKGTHLLTIRRWIAFHIHLQLGTCVKLSAVALLLKHKGRQDDTERCRRYWLFHRPGCTVVSNIPGACYSAAMACNDCAVGRTTGSIPGQCESTKIRVKYTGIEDAIRKHLVTGHNPWRTVTGLWSGSWIETVATTIGVVAAS